MFAPRTGLSSSASLGLTRWHLSPIFPRCPCLRTTSVYLLGWQWHDTFSILTLMQVSQLHDLYHIDESPWKLGRAEGVGFSSPQALGEQSLLLERAWGIVYSLLPLPSFTNKLRPREGTCLILSCEMVFIGPTLEIRKLRHSQLAQSHMARKPQCLATSQASWLQK